MIKALSLTLHEDIRQLSIILWQHDVAHKITEERGCQIIWVGSTDDQTLVKHYYQRWKNTLYNNSPEQYSYQTAGSQKRFSPGAYLADSLKYFAVMPVTITMVCLSILITFSLFTLPGSNTLLRYLIFIDPSAVGITDLRYGAENPMQFMQYLSHHWQILKTTLEQGQWWRLISPVFLHFSFLHIAFNAAMFLFFGQRVESYHSSKMLIFLIMCTGIFSNILQYFTLNGPGIFGGLSGIVYGLIGFCWIREKETPDGYGIPSGIYWFMIIWLILGYTGLLNYFTPGSVIANNAHAGGLISGIIAGFLTSGKHVRARG